MEISNTLRKFLQENAELLNGNKFDEFFINADKMLNITYGRGYDKDYSDLIHLLQMAGIDPLPYMSFVPPYFFINRSRMTSIKLPEGIAKLYVESFAECFDLKEIELLSTLQVINTGAFHDQNKLEKIIYRGTKDQWRSVNVFYRKNNNLFRCGVMCADGFIKYFQDEDDNWMEEED